MKSNYKPTHQFLAYVVLFSLFLQSCDGFSNQPVLRLNQAKGQEKVRSFIQQENIFAVVGQEFTTEKGYLVTFHAQEGNLQANVRTDASQQEPNYTNIPVIIAQGARLTELHHLGKTIQKRCIQVERASSGRPSRIVVVRGGLKGGMLEGDTTTSRNIKKLTEVVDLRCYFKKGSLEITPQNYAKLLEYGQKLEASFMSYDGGISISGWKDAEMLEKNPEILENLKGLLCRFNSVTKLKSSFSAERLVGLVEIIEDIVHLYESLIELDLSGCQLTDEMLEGLMRSIPVERLNLINIADNNITNELISDLAAAFPEVTFITQAPASGSIGSRFTARSANGNSVRGGSSISSNSPERSPQSSPNNSVSARECVSEKEEEKGEREKGEKEELPFYTPSEELTAYERMGFNKFLPAIAKGSIAYGKQLGQGGMGAVYQGTYQGKVVAVKKLLRLSEEQIASFQKEAMIMSNYRHRNLVSFLGYCPEEYAFMMEYASGGSLWSLLKSDEVISWEKRYEIGLDVAKGLEYLHDNGVVHCDLKSDNILLDINRRAKLTDFGISALRSEHVSSGKSTYGEWVGGTYCWMAPEIFHTQKNTKAGDVYAYGLVLWQLGSRKVPFAGIQALLPYISAGNKEVVTTDTPPLIKQVIELCWLPEPPLKKATDTKDRPSMQAVRLLLEKWNEKEEQELSEKAAKEVAEKEMLRNELAELQKALEAKEQEQAELKKQIQQQPNLTPGSSGASTLKEKEKEKEEEREKEKEKEKEQESPQASRNQPAKVREENAREPEINISELEAKISSFPKGQEILGKLKSTKAGERLSLKAEYKVLSTEQLHILFQHPCFRKITLDLSDNNLGASGAEAIAKALANTQIQTLNLSYNKIGASGAEAIAKALANTQIQTLDLSYNKIGASGAQEMAKALSNSQIHTLYLRYNKIGDSGAEEIAKALPNTQIHTLYLRTNYIGAQMRRKLKAQFPKIIDFNF